MIFHKEFNRRGWYFTSCSARQSSTAGWRSRRGRGTGPGRWGQWRRTCPSSAGSCRASWASSWGGCRCTPSGRRTRTQCIRSPRPPSLWGPQPWIIGIRKVFWLKITRIMHITCGELVCIVLKILMSTKNIVIRRVILPGITFVRKSYYFCISYYKEKNNVIWLLLSICDSENMTTQWL